MNKSTGTKKSTLKLDKADWDIIEALNDNPRLKITELAEKIDLHRNTISAKLMRDPQNGPIKTITRPNYTTGYIFATAMPNVNNKDTGRKIAQLAGVEEINVISGEWDFLIKIRGKSIEQIGSTIIEQLKNYCDRTVTAFSFWSFDGTHPYDLIRENK